MTLPLWATWVVVAELAIALAIMTMLVILLVETLRELRRREDQRESIWLWKDPGFTQEVDHDQVPSDSRFRRFLYTPFGDRTGARDLRHGDRRVGRDGGPGRTDRGGDGPRLSQ